MPNLFKLVTVTRRSEIAALDSTVVLADNTEWMGWSQITGLNAPPDAILDLFQRGPWLSDEEFRGAALGDTPADRLAALIEWLEVAEYRHFYPDQQLLRLGDLIARLESLPPDKVLPCGFDHPHSFRGNYSHLAFVPADESLVIDLLESARYADGNDYTGWHGGEFFMDLDTPVHFAKAGESREPLRNVIFAELGLAVPE